MEYHGKLYGKMGRRMIPLTLTSEDVDRMQLAIQDRERQIEEMEIRHAAAMLHTQTIVDEANAMRATLEAIEERFCDGGDTYEDWKFMGESACAFLSENEQTHPTT